MDKVDEMVKCNAQSPIHNTGDEEQKKPEQPHRQRGKTMISFAYWSPQKLFCLPDQL